MNSERKGARTTTRRCGSRWPNPGEVMYSPVTIRFAVTIYAAEYYDWYDRALRGDVERKNVTIMFYENNFDCRVDWVLVNAWPIAYEGPNLSTEDNDVAYESLTLIYERIERKNDPLY